MWVGCSGGGIDFLPIPAVRRCRRRQRGVVMEQVGLLPASGGGGGERLGAGVRKHHQRGNRRRSGSYFKVLFLPSFCVRAHV